MTGNGRIPETAEAAIPDATVARLPLYLRALVSIADTATRRSRPRRLAEAAGVNSAKVRKDLSYLGSYGTRGVGYDVEHLIHEIRAQLGLTQHWPIVIAGIGNLGQALAHYRGFAERGFRVAALVDADPAKVGMRSGGLEVARSRRPARARARRSDRDRRDRDPGDRGARRRRTHGRSGRPVDPQLRARGVITSRTA